MVTDTSFATSVLATTCFIISSEDSCLYEVVLVLSLSIVSCLTLVTDSHIRKDCLYQANIIMFCKSSIEFMFPSDGN